MSTPTTPDSVTPAPVGVDAVRKEAYKDGILTVEELRKIVAEMVKDGVTKQEKSIFETDMKKAMLDNPDTKSKAEIVAISQQILSTTELLKKFMYFVAAVLLIVVLMSLISNGQLMSLVLEALRIT